MNSHTKGIFYIIVSAVIFGMMPIAAKIIYINGSNPLTLTFHRFIFSIPCLFFMCSLSKIKIRFPSRIYFVELVTLALGYTITPLLLFISYSYIASGLATTVHFVYPVLVLLGCALFFHERINKVQVLCCILCLCGISSFYTPGNVANITGIVIAFASGITYAFYIIFLAKSGMRGVSSALLGLYLAIIASIILLVVNLVLGTLTFELTATGWILSILFGVGTSGFATVLFQMGVSEIGPQNGSLLSTFEPLTSVFAGVLLLGETLSFTAIIGVIYILVAIILLTISDTRAVKKFLR
ncbi:MAG: DMT family transporter [Acidaminococcaceae bacterium]|nr:DMT family transporter [Acidaminococcaceae bacterium]MDD4722551.1 DMT family transporter [Acidaminococcaceae bacterium]